MAEDGGRDWFVDVEGGERAPRSGLEPMSSIEIVGAGVITIFAMVNPRGVLEELSGLPGWKIYSTLGRMKYQ